MNKVNNKTDKIGRGSKNPNNLGTKIVDKDKAGDSGMAGISGVDKVDNSGIADVVDKVNNKTNNICGNSNNSD